MYNSLTRDQVRSFFCGAWSKYITTGDLTPIERVAADWIIQHPEYHSLIEVPDKAQAEEYTPERGETNPFLHLSMHLTISEQVAADSPRGIKDAYYTLIRNTGSEHAAAHQMMDCLGEVIWKSQRSNKPIDIGFYSRRIKALAEKTMV